MLALTGMHKSPSGLRRRGLDAPLWHESTDGVKSYAIKLSIHFGKYREALGDEYVILFRPHHQATKVLGVQYDEFVRDASSYSAVSDLMIASDMLITDYSAIAFDYPLPAEKH